MTHPIVECRKLEHSYADGTRALHDVSFVIERGQAVGIIGANGAGKSTLLLQMVGCLLPASGQLHVDGVAMEAATVPSIRQKVGMVFQNPNDQLFMPTVRADVAFGPRNQGLADDEVALRVEQALASVDSSHLIDRPPYHLSGGEKRAVSIATVLAMEPDILILDEPTAGLDPHSRRSVIQLLNRFGHSQIVASHDLDLILDICDRVILLNDGTVAADDVCERIMDNGPLLGKCGLEKPLSMQKCPRCGG